MTENLIRVMPAEGRGIRLQTQTTGRRWSFYFGGAFMSRIVVFANGLLNEPDILKERLQPEDRIFCANGGTLHALALGLKPDMIIGDLDSLPAQTVEQLEAAGVTIQHYPRNKDQTDLELALDRAIAEKPAAILLVTALGGRLDQMLANILLLTRPEYAPVRLTLIDGSQSATLVRDHQSITVKGEPGDTLSLVPLTPQVTGVTFSGVTWPLTEVTLTMGSTWSISNTLEDRQARVEIGEGMALLVHLKQSNKVED